MQTNSSSLVEAMLIALDFLFVVLLILKMSSIIDFSWLLVCCPIFISFIILLISGIILLIDKHNFKKNIGK